MMPRCIPIRLIAVFAGCCALAAASLADVVTLRDGRVFEGAITKKTAASITIDTKVAGIRTTLSFRRSEIESIEEKPLPEDFFAPKKKPRPERGEREARRPEREEKQTASAPTVRYLEIPIEGEFGKEVTAAGVRKALQWAERRGIDHIVFRIDSPGGMVVTAEGIADALRAHDGELTYHAVVEKEALSAAIWLVFSCDTIHMLPGSSVGAAVAFKQETTTGEIEVDAKLNSALASNVAAMAQRKGHDPAVIRAMMIMDAELWAVEEGESVELHNAFPEGRRSSGVQRIDSKQTVLTLTADEAERYGIARTLAAGEDLESALGDALEFADFRSAGGYGMIAMRDAKEERAKQLGEIEEVAERIPIAVAYIETNIEEAAAADPRNEQYFVWEGTQDLTDESRRKWRERTDDAIKAWERVMDGIRELARLQRRARELEIPEFTHDLVLEEAASRAQREIERLKRDRDRRTL